MTSTWVGIDLGASVVHAVGLGVRGSRIRVTAARTFDPADPTELSELVAMAGPAAAIAIDAPGALSLGVHAHDMHLAAKFRTARCGEIALGQDAGIWVPWTTPTDPSRVPGWMQVGFAVWTGLRRAGHEPLEVYPAGLFRVLAGGAVPKKTSLAGLRARLALLAPHVALPADVAMWSHDGVDALGAALVGRWSTEGRARGVGHTADGCDDSAIWIPDL